LKSLHLFTLHACTLFICQTGIRLYSRVSKTTQGHEFFQQLLNKTCCSHIPSLVGSRSIGRDCAPVCYPLSTALCLKSILSSKMYCSWL